MKSVIRYEDNDILVICKPAGFATQSGSVAQADVVSELKSYLAKKEASSGKNAPGKRPVQPYLGVIHRLDQPVEGLLVFAKNQKAAQELTKQLSRGDLNKQYYAVVYGKPDPLSDRLVDFLTKEEGNVAKVVTGMEAEYPQAKNAELNYRVVDSASGDILPEGVEISMVDISISTGRFHQIRAQMSHAGWPLLGDRKYGSEESLALSSRLNIQNVALCAYQLEIRHPSTGKLMTWKYFPDAKAFSMIKA